MTEPQNRNPREKDSCFCFGLFFVLLAFVLFAPFFHININIRTPLQRTTQPPFFLVLHSPPFFAILSFFSFFMLSREHPQRRRSFDIKFFRKRTCQQQNGVSYDRQKTESSTLRREREMMVFQTCPFSGMGKGAVFLFNLACDETSKHKNDSFQSEGTLLRSYAGFV